MNGGKIIPVIIGVLLLSFLGRSCTNSDWYSEYKKKKFQQTIEKLLNQSTSKDERELFERLTSKDKNYIINPHLKIKEN